MNYESSNTCFPMQSQNPGPMSTSGTPPGWIPGILQFTEATAQFNALNFSLDMLSSGSPGGWANSTVTCSNLAILQCPSENLNTPQYAFANGISYGMTNY